MQLALAVVGGAVAAAHGLVGLHTLRWTHTLTTLSIADRPKCAVATGLVWMDKENKRFNGCDDMCFQVYEADLTYFKVPKID